MLFPDAAWIWRQSREHDERDRRVQFRRSFELESAPESLELKITADSCYILWINGEYVNRGPARGFQRHWPFDRIEAAPFLRAGKNVIAVMVYQYGISNYSYAYENASGLLLSGQSGSINLGTGAAWKAREAPGYLRAVARASTQYGFQEFFDCRTGDDNWREINYDDADWRNIGRFEQRVAGSMPWHDFEERNIPLLTNNIVNPTGIVAIAKHRPVPDWRNNRNLCRIYYQEEISWQNASGNAQNVKFNPEVTGQVIDFGREVVGTVNFTVENAGAGEILGFMVCESLTGNSPDFPDKDRSVITSFAGRIILKDGVNRHELTMPWGFRYLVLFRRDPSDISVKVFVRQTVYPLEITGKFHASDENLNAIWKMSEHTQRCCMVDAYVDCPWRENAQWWGDALVQAKNTFKLSSDVRLFERGLRQIASQTAPNGLTYAMAPTCGHSCILPDYSAMWIITLYAHYWQTGTPAMWLELRDAADRIFSYFSEQTSGNGLLNFDDRYWLFLDWCPELFKNGAPTVYNLIYLWALQSALELAEVTGDGPRRHDYALRIEALKAAIAEKLYDRASKRLSDGITFQDEKADSCAPHTAALAIITGLFPEAHEQWLEEILLPLLRGNRTGMLLPSSYFMYYIFEAVKLKGRYRDVIGCIGRWWGEFAANDCSTTPENWLEKMETGSGSRCHAWSAHPLVNFSELILGVRQVAPGWKKIRFEPLMTQGRKAAGAAPTPHGPVEAEWDWTGPSPVKRILCPPGIELAEPENLA